MVFYVIKSIAVTMAIDCMVLLIYTISFRREMNYLGEKAGRKLSRNRGFIPHIPESLFIAILIMSILLFLIFFVWFSRSIVGDIRGIAASVYKIEAGERHIAISTAREDELGDLAQALNQLQDTLYISEKKRDDMENMRRDLITNVAHDLRTPLTSIIGYLGLVSDEKIPCEERSKYITVANGKAKQLKRLIEDLFEYSKLENNQVQISKKRINLSCFMEQLVDEFYADFLSRNLVVKQEIEENLYVSIDGDKFVRAISNILSNAIKYGSDGKQILVRVFSKKGKAVIQITNYGKVMKAYDLEHIFDRCYRAEASRSLETGGSGLGLPIAKNIVEMHQGTIKATSSEKGTTFEIKVNLEDREEQ